MTIRQSTLALALAFAALLPGRTPAQTAEDLVRWVYASLADDSGLGLWAIASPEQRVQFLTPRLAAVFDANDAAEEEPCIDYAPEIDAQDYDGPELARTLQLVTETAPDGAQKITATFTIFGEARRVVWSFVPSNGAMLLDDITGTDGYSLAAVTCG